MNSLKSYLYSAEGRVFLLKAYSDEGRSTYSIAEELGCYPQLVRRAMVHHKIPLRNRGEAQKLALEKGRQKIPTQGRARTEDERRRISESQTRAWRDAGPELVEEYSRRAREQWARLGEQERQAQLEASRRRMAQAHDGSRLERFLRVSLKNLGYPVDFRTVREGALVDILIENHHVAIQVDGPPHFLPIFGEDRLAATMASDKERDEALLKAGYSVIRVRAYGTVSQKKMREGFGALLVVLKDVSQSSYHQLEIR